MQCCWKVYDDIMPSVGRYTHAILSRVPDSFQNVPTVDGTCIDIDKAREQHQHLASVLRDLGLDVLELPPDEQSPVSVFTADCAFIINGIALICRPRSGNRAEDVATVKAVLKKDVGVRVEELDNDNAFISGSDILFTGSEIFVGVGQDSNTEGASAVARLWPEYHCTTIALEGSKHFNDRLNVAGADLLAVGSSHNCQTLLKRVEKEAMERYECMKMVNLRNTELFSRYQTLTVPEDEAAKCLFVNGNLLTPHSNEIPDSSEVSFHS